MALVVFLRLILTTYDISGQMPIIIFRIVMLRMDRSSYFTAQKNDRRKKKRAMPFTSWRRAVFGRLTKLTSVGTFPPRGKWSFPPVSRSAVDGRSTKWLRVKSRHPARRVSELLPLRVLFSNVFGRSLDLAASDEWTGISPNVRHCTGGTPRVHRDGASGGESRQKNGERDDASVTQTESDLKRGTADFRVQRYTMSAVAKLWSNNAFCYFEPLVLTCRTRYPIALFC